MGLLYLYLTYAVMFSYATIARTMFSAKFVENVLCQLQAFGLRMPIHTGKKLGTLPSQGCDLSTEMLWQMYWNLLVNCKEDKFDSDRTVHEISKSCRLLCLYLSKSCYLISYLISESVNYDRAQLHIYCATISYMFQPCHQTVYMIYLLTAVGLSPGGSTLLHTNNT
jgi:hypothetical protein